MKINLFHKLIVLTAILFISVSYFYNPINGMNAAPSEYPLFQKGMSYVTWNRESFSSSKSDESLRTMAAAGISAVAIIPTWYQETFDATDISEDENRTPSDESIRHAIRRAHENNMLVMLKPHIDLISADNNSRADIGFQTDEKWNRWFSQYVTFITHYARIAEEERVEFFCVGTELSFAATKTDFWKNDLIPEVRKIFSGQLTYAANWDDYAEVHFWEDLDYAGIDAYFPLAKKSAPSLGELKEGWRKWLTEIELWQRTIKKPVLFTEAGYCSVGSAARKPWEENRGDQVNTQLQKDCYKALLETFWNKPWFFGVYWWNWNTYPGSGGPNNKLYTPQNKPALDEMKSWYTQFVDKKASFEKYLSRLFGDADTAERAAIETSHASNIPAAGVAERRRELARPTHP